MRTLSIRWASRFMVLILGLSLSGCFSHRFGDPVVTRYHEDGRAKPLAVIPLMIDTSAFDVPWSIAEELTTAIIQNVAATEQIYIKQGDEYALVENPFGTDLSWVQSEFAPQQFAVFLELAEHEFTPALGRTPQEEPRGNYLNMGVRIRVIDLRGEQPKIVLQEIVRDHYYIPRTYFPPNYQETCWGTTEYTKTPMGIAHARITQQISTRIADYILLAQSR